MGIKEFTCTVPGVQKLFTKWLPLLFSHLFLSSKSGFHNHPLALNFLITLNIILFLLLKTLLKCINNIKAETFCSPLQPF